MTQVAFLGLGTMGGPMAGHVLRCKYLLGVWNRGRARASAWAANYGMQPTDKLAEAVHAADIVCTCLGRDEDVRQVVLGEQGAMAAMRKGALLIDHTTTSAALAVQLHQQAKAMGLGFLDAPVSGGQSGAEQGSLAIMLGGARQDYNRAKPVLDAYAKTTRLMGGPGKGQLAKMANQICVTGVLQGLAEALVFARANHLDGDALLEAIGQGAAQSWQMNNRGSTMLRDTFDFGFAVNWMIKDLGYCIDQAHRRGLRLPVTQDALDQYRQLAQQGGGNLDTSSLIRSTAKRSGLHSQSGDT